MAGARTGPRAGEREKEGKSAQFSVKFKTRLYSLLYFFNVHSSMACHFRLVLVSVTKIYLNSRHIFFSGSNFCASSSRHRHGKKGR